jgi:hypothetical protein
MSKKKEGDYLCIKKLKTDYGFSNFKKGVVYFVDSIGTYHADSYRFYLNKEMIKNHFVKIKRFNSGNPEQRFARWLEAEGYTMTTEKMKVLDYKELYNEWKG